MVSELPEDKLAFEFESAWLEIRSSSNHVDELKADASLLSKLPKLSEILEMADKTNASMKQKYPDARFADSWDYSTKLSVEEARQIHNEGIFTFPKRDSRSISFSRNILYKGSNYELTLFVEIKQ